MSSRISKICMRLAAKILFLSLLLSLLPQQSPHSLFKEDGVPKTQAAYINKEGIELVFVKKQNDTWEHISDWNTADFSFDSLSAIWEGKGSDIRISVRTRHGPVISDWQELEADYDLMDRQSLVFSELLFVKQAEAFQYKVEIGSDIHTHEETGETGRLLSISARDRLLSSNGIKITKVEQFFCSRNEWVCRSNRPGDILKHLQISYLASQSRQKNVDVVHAEDAPRIISRAEWGADESLQLKDNWQKARDEYCSHSPWACKPLSDKAQQEFNQKRQEILTNFPDEVKTVRTISQENGQELAWPRDYMAKVYKIVLHHTADNLASPGSENDNDNKNESATVKPDQISMQEYQAKLRSTYYYHTVTRGWGDIGYNYIVDGLGNIYEGRAGGDFVVGAHVAWHNEGSIGIALMGNYQEISPSSGSIQSLVRALTYITKKYNVDPRGSGSFRGKYLPNIIGHRDLASTACPGEQFYKQIERIRTLIQESDLARDLKVTTLGESNQANNSYSGQYISDEITDVSLMPGKSRTVNFRFTNTGTAAWDAATYLASNPVFGPLLDVEAPENLKKNGGIAFMKGGRTEPGQIAEFPVTLSAGYAEQVVLLDIAPVVNGEVKVQSVLMPVSVTSPDPGYEFVSSRYPANNLFWGEQTQGEVILKNTGNFTWHNNGDNAIVLKPDHPGWRATLFHPENSDILAYLRESSVEPGETGHFIFDLTAPNQSGSFEEHFTPYIKQIGYFKDGGMFFRFEVKDPGQSSGYRFAQEPLVVSGMSGEKVRAHLTVTNTDKRSIRNLTNDTFVPLIYGLEGGSVDNLEFDTSTLRSGETTQLSFDVTLPLKAGRYDGKLILRQDNTTLLEGPVIFALYVKAGLASAQRMEQSYDLFPLAGTKNKITLKFKNNGNIVWKKDDVNVGKYYKRDQESLLLDESWVTPLRPATMMENTVYPGETGTFEFYITPHRGGLIEDTFKLGMTGYGWLDMDPFVVGVYARDVDGSFIGGMLSGSEESTVTPPAAPADTINDTTSAASYRKNIKVKLGYSTDQNTMIVSSASGKLTIQGNGENLQVDENSLVTVTLENGKVQVTHGNHILAADQIRFVPNGDTPLIRIDSWEHYAAWDTNKRYNDNTFRGDLTVMIENNSLVSINELGLEDYLKGVAETAPDTHPEKRKVMSIIARTYALFYLLPENRKFKNAYYDASDDPNIFQKYLGYGYEQRYGEWVDAVTATKGTIVLYEGKLVKTPYFTQSDGRTRSAEEVWGWKDTPYLVSVLDPLCPEKVQKGHGVGLSGCGAEQAARNGKSYDEIIKYYYRGVDIGKVE